MTASATDISEATMALPFERRGGWREEAVHHPGWLRPGRVGTCEWATSRSSR